MARAYRFVWLDVFTRSRLKGNQLAVFPDAHGLSADTMQQIARETHLSETTFVFPRDPATDAREGYPTRIFAVFGEMPFAGQPTLGTAWHLARATGQSEVALAVPVGRIPVRFRARDGDSFGEMDQPDPVLGSVHNPRALAEALGVSVEEFDRSGPAQTISTGVPFGVVPFRSADRLASLRPEWSRLETYLRGTDAKFLYLIARRDGAHRAVARMFFSGGEDPATGSAAGPAVAWMVLHGWARPDEEVVIAQGDAVLRPSRIHARARLEGGRPVGVRVGGYCVPVLEGTLTVP